jgi:hypothetical protein
MPNLQAVILAENSATVRAKKDLSDRLEAIS